MRLYSYYRSSASYRVRIAMNIKKVGYDVVAINLAAGEDQQAEFREVNRAGMVPVLELNSGQRISQSTAIIDWLEQKVSSPSLLQGYADNERALIQQIVNIVACDIHPINNLRVLKYLTNKLSVDEEDQKSWYRHWVNEGFTFIESIMGGDSYAVGNQVTMADIYLIPQVYNAQRFSVDMTQYPKIMAANDLCMQLDAFIAAHPDNQSDAK